MEWLRSNGRVHGGRKRWSRPGLWGILSVRDGQGKHSFVKETERESSASHPELCLETVLMSQLRGGATVMLWVEARDVTKHPTVHRAAPTVKDHLIQKVTSAEVDKPCACAFCAVAAVSVLFMAGPLVPGM